MKLLSKLFDVSINTLLGSPRELINVCVGHMVTEEFSKEQAREYMKQLLPKLDYWKRYEELSDDGKYPELLVYKKR